MKHSSDSLARSPRPSDDTLTLSGDLSNNKRKGGCCGEKS
jgi:hypothetical protein